MSFIKKIGKARVIIFLIITIILFIFFYFITLKKNEKTTLNTHLINIKLMTSVHPSLKWEFQPIRPEINIIPGEVTTIEYLVKNLDTKANSGVAVFSYYPSFFDPHFRKINCFCYDIQTLNSGEQKRYSLIFMVDPKVTKDSKTKYIKEAIIQFTFFSKEEYDKKKG